MPSLWNLLTSLTVEPVILFMMMAETTRGTLMQQLLQDKICSNEYHMSDDACYNLATSASSPAKDQILSLSATSASQKELIALVPHILLTMFAASWCDLFPNGRRFVILFSASCQLIETIFLLVNALFYDANYMFIILNGVPSSLLGSGYMMASFSYLSVAVPNDEKPVRFLVCEIFMGIAVAGGFFVNSYLIGMRKSLLFPDAAGIRNYADICILNMVLLSATVIWTYVRIAPVAIADSGSGTMIVDEEEEDNENERRDSGLHQESDEVTTSEGMDVEIVTPSSSSSCCSSITHLLKTAFSLKSIAHVFRTVMRKRPQSVHLICWMAMAVHFAIYFPLNSLDNLTLLLVEKMYRWDASQYSHAMAVLILVAPITISVYTEFIVTKFNLHPLTIMINGMTSTFLKYLSFGSITTPVGWYAQLLVGCLDGTACSGVRSYLSMNIPANQVTSFFCFLQTVEAALPFVATAIASYIFSFTVHSYPTCAVHASILPLLICLAVVCYADIKVRFAKRENTPTDPGSPSDGGGDVTIST
jgi:hypothetical protein